MSLGATSTVAPLPAARAPHGPWILAVLLLAVLPSVGTLRAPWIAEDAAILAQAGRSGPWADWTRPQYGLEIVRWWRPVVSATWDLQERWTGIDPLPLRLFNLALHAGTALLAGALVLRLGAGRAGAFLAGAFFALAPEQGGTVTWLSGRTDLLSAFLLAASVWVSLGRRTWCAAPLAFLASAAKEFGLLAPAWSALAARARGESWRTAAARAAPGCAGVVVALALRQHALGTLTGGYPAANVALGVGLPLALRGLLASTWFSWTLVLAAGAAGAALGSLRARAWPWALACAALACAPLYPLLDDGVLEAQNRRLFTVAELGLALAVGLALAQVPRRRNAAIVLGLALCGARVVPAWRDTHEWARAAEFGEERVAAARAAVAGAPPGSGPVLVPGFPVSWEGAYCLGFGLPDRFRAPFPASARPIWPLRPMFLSAASERDMLTAPRADGTIWPLDDPRTVPALAVADEDGAPLTALVLDPTALGDPTARVPALVVAGGPARARLELVLYTEDGYEPFPGGALDEHGGWRLDARALLAASYGIAASAALTHAADLGARSARLELRALDERGKVLAASAWIELSWPEDGHVR